MVKYGERDLAAPILMVDDDAPRNVGSISMLRPKEPRPASIVKKYDNNKVISNILPASEPKSAIPGVTRPIISNGIKKTRNWLKRLLKVNAHLTPHSGSERPHTTPIMSAIAICTNRLEHNLRSVLPISVTNTQE